MGSLAKLAVVLVKPRTVKHMGLSAKKDLLPGHMREKRRNARSLGARVQAGTGNLGKLAVALVKAAMGALMDQSVKRGSMPRLPSDTPLLLAEKQSRISRKGEAPC